MITFWEYHEKELCSGYWMTHALEVPDMEGELLEANNQNGDIFFFTRTKHGKLGVSILNLDVEGAGNTENRKKGVALDNYEICDDYQI